MKIHINRLDYDFLMEAVNEDGKSIRMDSSPEIGGHQGGMRPMQLLLSALGGCSSVDVIHILKKQRQEITSFEVEVTGDTENMDAYRLFKNIFVHFKIKGNVHTLKAENAVRLSIEKYCSVAKILEPTATITFYVIVE